MKMANGVKTLFPRNVSKATIFNLKLGDYNLSTIIWYVPNREQSQHAPEYYLTYCKFFYFMARIVFLTINPDIKSFLIRLKGDSAKL